MGGTFGSRMRAQRQLCGLSQYDLAALCGVRQVTISRWEQNICGIAAEHHTKLVSALGPVRVWPSDDEQPTASPAEHHTMDRLAHDSGLAAMLDEHIASLEQKLTAARRMRWTIA